MIRSRTKLGRVLPAAALAIAASGSGAAAQVSNSSEFQAYMESLIAAAKGQVSKNVYLPGVNQAVTAPRGTVYGSLVYLTPRGGVAGAGGDASFSIGAGFGDAAQTVGVGVTANITGTVPFGTDGDFSVKFSRQVNSNTFVGVAFNRLGGWGSNAGINPNGELLVTHFGNFGGGTPYVLSGGVGSAAFTTAQGGQTVGAFLGLGVGLTESIGIGASLKDQHLTVGMGIKVPSVKGLSFTADASNVNRGRGGGITYSFGVHYAASVF